MEDKRRYESGLHPIFDSYFTRMMAESPILNPQQVVDIHTVMADRRNIESLLLELKGNPQGVFYRPGEAAKTALLPAIENELKELQEKYIWASQMQVNSGRPPLQDWPPDLLKKKYQLESQYDTTLLEVAELEKKLATFTDQEDDKKDRLMLRYGPIGTSQLRGGFCVEMDYQQVAPDENGILRIASDKSPYNGMRVVDYFSKVHKPWVLAKRKLDSEQYKIYHGLKGTQLTDDQREQWAKRKNELFEKFPEWHDLFGLKLPGKPAIPKWPAGCVNHKTE